MVAKVVMRLKGGVSVDAANWEPSRPPTGLIGAFKVVPEITVFLFV